MSARTKTAPDEQMTVEEFLAFTATRPQEERWELVEGVPVMSASPIGHHQMIVANITGFLWRFKKERNSSWFPIPGTGTRVPASEKSLPQPDIMVLERPPNRRAGLGRRAGPVRGALPRAIRRQTRLGAARSMPACPIASTT